ncbi:uncharacterized protein [Porites lutea]|uniref:uncharacterized protein isoform X2 n=1 Tax=Porites lutea TaxID=51062 RepID=UPI003CC6DCBF
MASTTTRLPPWLLLSKEDIVKSSEWKDLTSELFDAVQQQLTESHVSYFSDLTDSEKIMFLDRAAKLVRDGSSYRNLTGKVSRVLDQNLNEEVTQKVVDPSNKQTKTELLLQEASSASIQLLQRWPALRTKLFACLNRPLPKDLRKAIWKMFLANPIVRQEYLEKALRNKQETISAHDTAISQKCHAFLSLESASPRELVSHPAVLAVMKSALSYRHVVLKHTSAMADTDYLLVLPFLKALVADDGDKPVDAEEIAGFIEAYFTFMDRRSPLMRDSRSKEFFSAQKQYGNKMTAALDAKDKQLLSSLQRLLLPGFLSLDVVCYIWDQYILSMKLPSFDCIATFSTALLMLLRDQILKCRNAKEVEEMLLAESKNLTIRDFQTVIDRHFMEDWKRQITEEVHGSELPLVDPVATVGRSAEPWSMWFRAEPPSRQRVEDRRQTREEREEERRRKLAEQRREEARKRREEEEQMRHREQEMRREFETEKKREKGQLVALERELERERNERASVEKEKDDEIVRLQAELARLGGTSAPSPRGMSSSAAPSVNTPHPSEPSPEPSRSSHQEAEDLVRSLIGGTLRSLDLVAHGTEEQRTNLDVVTREALDRNSLQYREAERELFGRELEAEEWDRMKEEERSEKTNELMKRLKDKRKLRLNAAAVQ